jgi:hypothetical protein
LDLKHLDQQLWHGSFQEHQLVEKYEVGRAKLYQGRIFEVDVGVQIPKFGRVTNISNRNNALGFTIKFNRRQMYNVYKNILC